MQNHNNVGGWRPIEYNLAVVNTDDHGVKLFTWMNLVFCS